MRVIRLIVIVLVLGSNAPLLAHAEPSSAEIDEYLSSRHVLLSSPGSPNALMNALLRANLPTPGLGAAAKQLAATVDISEPAAALLLEAELRLELSSTYQGLAHNQYPPAQIVEMQRRAAVMEPQKEWPWTVLRELLGRWGGACRIDAITQEFFARPGAERRFLAEAEPDCSNWTVYLTSRPRPSLLARWRLTESVRYLDDLTEAAASAELFLSASAAPMQREVAVLAARKHWIDLARAGLSNEILRAAAALPRQLLADILDVDAVGAVTLDGVEIASREDSADLALEVRPQWVIALDQNQRSREARTWLARFVPLVKQEPQSSLVEYHFEDDRMIRKLLNADSREDPFDDFIADGDTGWYFTAARQAPMAELAVARFFAAHGYTGIVKEMRTALCSRLRYLGEPSRNLPGWLPPAANAERLRLAQLYNAATTDLYGCTTASVAMKAIPAAAQAYAEKLLPPSVQRGSADGGSIGTNSPLLAPLAKFDIVRADLTAERVAAISVSQAVDPTGEVGAGGYWLHLYDAAIRTWRKPIYLGLQQMQPYIVLQRSGLPLIREDRLQIEVQVRELAGDALSFPPIQVPIKRQQDGVYIERSLAELTLDSDSDGLTDVLEDKLRTDPRSADTDRDGVPDGVDAMPQISVQAPPHADAEIVRAIVQEIIMRSPTPVGASIAPQPLVLDKVPRVPLGPDDVPRYVRFLRADPTLFTGMMVAASVVVLSDADQQYLESRYGLQLSTSFTSIWFNRARDRAVVRWTTGWSGGVLKFERTPSSWKSSVVTRWVT